MSDRYVDLLVGNTDGTIRLLADLRFAWKQESRIAVNHGKLGSVAE